jgi:hypothetical protein
MSIVDFPQRSATGNNSWDADEMAQLMALVDATAEGHASTWQVGTTERGEPQFYVLGPGPDHDCVLCVSRLAHGRLSVHYVLEDGTGRLLGEAPALHLFAEQVARAAARTGRSFIARATLLLCAVRLTIEEKIEPLFEESQELLARFAPQLAAFA